MEKLDKDKWRKNKKKRIDAVKQRNDLAIPPITTTSTKRHVTKKGCNNYSTTIIVLLCVDCISEESGNETEGFETSLIAGNGSV